MEIELNDLLKKKESEILDLKCNLEKTIKENINLKKFNEDLHYQVKILTGKLNLLQQLNKNLNKSSIENNQTEKLSENFLSNNWIEESDKKKVKISHLVTSVAEETFSMNDYIYNQETRTFYSKSTGWYFYEDSKLFYDPNSKNYYKYDEINKSYNFYSSLEDQKRILNKNLNNKLNEESEEGEVLSSDEEKTKTKINNNFNNLEDIIPPTIRLIVQKSNLLEIGSLMLITFNGAKIGKSSQCELHLEDDFLNDFHASITYNDKKMYYSIRDLNSICGTYVNNKLLESNELIKINHGDIIKLGNIEFLIHIHEKDNTCIYCEPGCVQAKLKTISLNNNCDDISSKHNKEKQRKRELKKIKKKFGINSYENEIILLNKYQDRAMKRRKTKGISCEYGKTESASLDKPIDNCNKGFQLLEKMGWKKDESKESGIINVKIREEKKGLGFL